MLSVQESVLNISSVLLLLSIFHYVIITVFIVLFALFGGSFP